jgi:DNA-binding response OmpR family regulator
MNSATVGGIDPNDEVTILLIDDDPVVAQAVKPRLELDGYRVQVARDSEEAVRMAGRERPDLIFLDIGMPRLRGRTVLETLRSGSVTRRIPIVVVSRSGESRRLDGLELGALDSLMRRRSPGPERGIEGWARE